MVRFPTKTGVTGKVAHFEALEGVAPVAKKETQKPKAPADGMLPTTAPVQLERHVPVQGQSLIERTLRYDQAKIAKSEAKLQPLISHMQANGWFPPETLAAITRAGTKEEIVGLLQQCPDGLAGLDPKSDLDVIATDILQSPARPSTVLLEHTRTPGYERFAGPLLTSFIPELRDVGKTLRHYEHAADWLGIGFDRYVSLEQMSSDRTSAISDAITRFASAIAPLTLADVRQAQAEFHEASQVRGDGDRAVEKVIDKFAETASRMPGPLWAELQSHPDVRADLRGLLRSAEHGTDWEQSRHLVALFHRDGVSGAGLHQLFLKANQLDLFLSGGFIPHEISRGAGELW